MVDQAHELRNLMLQASRPATGDCAAPKFLAVAGGKGGVGTTTLAVLLARALTKAGQRVVLVDGEGKCGNLAVYCGVIPTSTTWDVLESKSHLADSLQPGPDGMLLLPGAWREVKRPKQIADAVGEPAQPSPDAMVRFVHDLQRLDSITDFVIVDAGSGSDACEWNPLWQVADVAMIVTTTDSVAVLDCYSLIKQLVGSGVRGDFHAIINRVPDATHAADVQQRLETSCRRFLGIRLELPGWVPLDPKLLSAASIGESPSDLAAFLAVEDIANQLRQLAPPHVAAKETRHNSG